MAKILPLSEAIAEFVRDGDTIALEGFTHLIPYAAGHEIIRQKHRNLTLIRMTPDVLYDQMIGAGCAQFRRQPARARVGQLFGVQPQSQPEFFRRE